MTDPLVQFIYYNNKFLGIEWHLWKVVGWLGNLIFFSRFFVQWLASEKRKQVVVPNAFWWLSLVGSLCLFSYGLYQQDSVFIFAYAFTWIPYVRNLILGSRHAAAQLDCPRCESTCPSWARFCPSCGARVRTEEKPR